MSTDTLKTEAERRPEKEEKMPVHPMTTEEPIDHPALEREIARLNEVNEDDHVPKGVIEPMINPNKIPDLPLVGDALEATYEDAEAEAEAKADKELWMTTEANRFIPNDDTPLGRALSARRCESPQRDLLVFADKSSLIEKQDRVVVTSHYGAGPTGSMDASLKPTRKRRSYLVACDFSDDSFYALEWTMGTMMRDGDELHVVAVVNREDNPDTVKQAGMTLAKELKAASNTMTEEAKKTLGQMQLFDVKLVTYAMSGKVKDVLASQIHALPLTMVVCGSRGRSRVKRMLMGSVSTFLVHKSSVPVSVIRPQKKKKKTRGKLVEAPPLSESVKTGQLAVDELSQQKMEV